MTQCVVFDRVAVTGLTNATWLRDKSLDSLYTVPTGMTYAIFEIATNSTGATYGIQNADESADTVYASAARASIVKFITINAAKTVDLYVGNTTNGTWNLIGYTDHITAITPVDKAGTTGAGTKTVDCSADFPSGAINGSALIEFNLNMKVGWSANITTQEFPNLTPRNHLIVPLDASRQFFFYSGGAASTLGDIKLLGWLPAGAAVHETTYPKLSHAGDSVWRDSTQPAVTTVLDNYLLYASSDSVLANMRKGGSAYNVVDKSMLHRRRWVQPDTNGLVDTWANNSVAKFTRFMGLVGDTAAAAISTLDTFVAGATATVVFDKSVTSITRLRATCAVLLPDGITPIDTHYIDITSFSGSGTTWTFTAPSPTDATDGIRFGAVTITPTTNSGVGADFTSAVYSKTDYDSVNIETPVSGNVCEGDIPALAMDDQLAYEYGLITPGGVYSDPTESFIGTQTIWRYVVSEFKWYSFTITAEGRCQVEHAEKLAITCKTGENSYKKHYLGLSDNVTYFVEQLEDAEVSAYHYKVIFKPQTIVPDIDLHTGK